MTEPSPDTLRSLQLGRRIRSPWEGKWQRLIELAMPYRTSFWGDGVGMPTATIYDSAGVVGIEEMANRLQSGILPAGQQWARLEPHEGADENLRVGLQSVQDEMFRQLDRSNFHAEINDAFKDLSGFGQCCVRITGGDWQMPLRVQAIPLPNVWVTPGPDGRWADIHVRYRLPCYAIEAQWPGAQVPRDLKSYEGERDDGQMVEVIDSWLRDLGSATEKWQQETHIGAKHVIARREHSGAGACPYVFGRWSKAAGDLYAVGQGMLALPDLETLNEIERLVLAHAEMGLSGMWQAEDDGVLNPWSVRLEPGTIIPIAPGSKGLQAVPHPGTKVDLGLMQPEERRHAIRKMLFNEQLGARSGTPPTAFEIQERMQDLARQVGPAFHRVWHELVVPMLVRVRRVLIDQGVVVMPLIDGQKVKAVSASSMVRAAAIGDMQRIKAMLNDVAMFWGPQAIAQSFELSRFLEIAADRYDVPRNLPYTRAEMQQNAQRTGEMMGGAMAQAAEAGAGTDVLGPLLAAMGGSGKGMGGGGTPGGMV